jgi:hypothetical protein
LIGALIEELDEIVEDVHQGKKRSETSAKLETNAAQLDGQLKDLLKKLEGQNFDVSPCY